MSNEDLQRSVRTANVLSEVFRERARQDERWGVQDHPLVDPDDPVGMYTLGRPYAQLEKVMKARFREHAPSDAVILLEEVFEALAEPDIDKAREEFVQVAAVAVMIVESIDRATDQGTLDRLLGVTDSDGGICDSRWSDLVPQRTTEVVSNELLSAEVPCQRVGDHSPHAHKMGACYGKGDLRREPETQSAGGTGS